MAEGGNQYDQQTDDEWSVPSAVCLRNPVNADKEQQVAEHQQQECGAGDVQVNSCAVVGSGDIVEPDISQLGDCLYIPVFGAP